MKISIKEAYHVYYNIIQGFNKTFTTLLNQSINIIRNKFTLNNDFIEIIGEGLPMPLSEGNSCYNFISSDNHIYPCIKLNLYQVIIIYPQIFMDIVIVLINNQKQENNINLQIVIIYNTVDIIKEGI